MIFGSRYSPSLFFLISDLRSFVSQLVHPIPFSRPTTLMINWVSFPHAQPSSRDINPSHKDPMNQGVEDTNLGPYPTFVNNKIMAEVRSLVSQAAYNSVLTASAFIINSDLVKEPISVEKLNASSLILTKPWHSSPTPGQWRPPTHTTREPLSWLSYSH